MEKTLLEEARSIKIKGIVGLCLLLTLFGAIVTFVLDIICGIKILTTNWKNKEVEDYKVIWGIFCFVLLGPIAAIVFGSIASKALANSQEATEDEE